jgi:hypothetical protein
VGGLRPFGFSKDRRSGSRVEKGRVRSAQGTARGLSAVSLPPCNRVVRRGQNSVVGLATLQIGWGIVVESTLSFLGTGVPPPAPIWGHLVVEGRDGLDQACWIAVCPGLAIMLVVLSFNRFGDRMHDALDPKLRQHCCSI